MSLIRVIIRKGLHDLIFSYCVKDRERNCRSCLQQRGGVEKMLLLIFGTWGKGDLLRNLDFTF